MMKITDRELKNCIALFFFFQNFFIYTTTHITILIIPLVW